jgi:hypothetical protein
MIVAPLPLPVLYTHATWTADVLDHARGLFETVGRHAEIRHTALLLLVPKPSVLPVFSDSEEEAREALKVAEAMPLSVNAHGDVVLLVPLVYCEHTKDAVLVMAKHLAALLEARATALLSEVWMRPPSAPVGTGSDHMLVHIECAGFAPETHVASIETNPVRTLRGKPVRDLAPWVSLEGPGVSVSGTMGFLPDDAHATMTRPGMDA